MKHATYILLILPLLTCSGCGSGGSGVAVSGTVTRGGQAVEAATILFLPEKGTVGPTVSGKIAQGRYRIQPHEGLQPGKYAVQVSLSGTPRRKIVMESGSKGFSKIAPSLKFERELKGSEAQIDLEL